MKVDLQRFQDVKNKSHLDLAHILCASFSLKREEVIRHVRNLSWKQNYLNMKP